MTDEQHLDIYYTTQFDGIELTEAEEIIAKGRLKESIGFAIHLACARIEEARQTVIDLLPKN